MNAGASAATGDVLLFLHADTRLPTAASTPMLDRHGAMPDGAWGRFDVHDRRRVAAARARGRA